MTLDKESLGTALIRASTMVAMIAVGYLVGYIHGINDYSRAAPGFMFWILVAYSFGVLVLMLYLRGIPRPWKSTAN